MKHFFQVACSAPIVRNALGVALFVGTLLNAINQGSAVIHGENIDWLRFALNYVVPYCVASYSATRNDMSRSHDE
jgi:hypothetical protein